MVTVPVLLSVAMLIPLGDVESHLPVTRALTVTNDFACLAQPLRVATSCACLAIETNDRTPGNIGLIFTPAGFEGPVRKSAELWYGSNACLRLDVTANVVDRLALKPSRASFGVVDRTDAVRRIRVRCRGYAGASVTSVIPPENPTFDLAVGEDNRSLSVGMKGKDRLPGSYSEVWRIGTSDPEVPFVNLPVSATVVDDIRIVPGLLSFDSGEGPCSRVVSVSGAKEVCAHTGPRVWGKVKAMAVNDSDCVRLVVTEIDPAELGQFSKEPYLQIDVLHPGRRSYRLPVRIER